MFVRFIFSLWLCLGAAHYGVAADPRPMVGPGATKDEVIDAYGWPSGQSQSGTKEMLSYPQGVVLLEKGRVERVDFAMNTPWPAPRPRPGPSPAVPKIANEQINFWLTSFDAATRDAARRHARILALFTGSDWSAACRQFHDEVALQPEFVNAFTGDFVFLQLDFPKGATQTAELREQNTRLRERYAVTVYPTLLVLATDGTLIASVDLNKPQPGNGYRERVMAAVRETRDAISGRPPAPAPVATEPVAAKSAEPLGDRTLQIGEAVRSARTTVALSILLGLGISGGLIWLVWRKRPAVPGRPVPSQEPPAATANGLPTRAQIAAWTNEKVRAVTAALAESEGYVVAAQPPGADRDLVLKQPGETRPRVLVCCAAGIVGPVAAKRIREFLGALMAEGVPTGWYVSAGGFAVEARVYAEQNGLVLIDGEQLLAQLRDLPPMVLPKVLARAG